MEFEAVDQEEELARSRIGEVVNGKWKLVELLGCGGMAAVFGAEGIDGRRVALKMLHPQIGKISDIRERFLREGTVANRVNHPGVVRVLEQTSKDDPTAILVMERLEGDTLSDVLRRNRHRLPVPTLLGHLDELLDVLAVAHENGIVHRDLKPDNLFVTREGTLKVLDFGIARVRDGLTQDQKTRTGVMLGTVPFMSPEQALGKQSQIDGRTDLFAVGAIAFYALSGRVIHEAESDSELLIAMATRSAPPLQSIAPTASPDVCAVVDQALAFSREARYPDAKTMRADVRALREQHSPPFAVRQASSRSQRTNVVLPSPVSVKPAGVAQGALVPSSETVAGPGPSTPTRIADAFSKPTSIGPGPDTPTRVGNPHSQPTVVGPTPDSATRVAVSSEKIALAPSPQLAMTAVEKVAVPGPSVRPTSSTPNESPKRNIVLLGLLVVAIFAGVAYWLGANTSEDPPPGAESRADLQPASGPPGKRRSDETKDRKKARARERKDER